MIKRLLKLMLLCFFLTSCNQNKISDTDIKKAQKLSKEGMEYSLSGEKEKALEKYKEAFKINSKNLNYLSYIIGIYVEQKDFKKAFETLEELPVEDKKSVFYYQTKAAIYALKKDYKSAKLNFQKAYKTAEPIGASDIEDEYDLMPLTGHAMLETYAGHKDKALERLNETLKLDWLSESNIMYIEQIRNEIEYYRDIRFDDFSFSDDITICTTNVDSLEKILYKNHINSTGSSSSGKIYIAEKFRRGLNKLNITPCKDSIN
ncbi:hypothetical protein DVK85_08745 [Flavobacterium arcticum]|uniref:Uncharacterized protein n=1 Tax=Flavobacterium arcticum TaxID=1784713 RepID=A0A345HCK1_9FLAO|nr:hypothetical protein [Flavobacterium arcticum]AXG74311.1 hypothetical protein DVK85_08745 [Flavobacterium arcticum]KAF2507575.1 hypothetical protein E0W72_11905 [Flavobacterium arcticum]